MASSSASSPEAIPSLFGSPTGAFTFTSLSVTNSSPFPIPEVNTAPFRSSEIDLSLDSEIPDSEIPTMEIQNFTTGLPDCYIITKDKRKFGCSRASIKYYSNVLDRAFKDKKTDKKDGKEDKDETEVEVEEDPKAWIQVLKFIHRPFWCIGHFPVTNIKYYKEMAPIAMRYEIVMLQVFCEDGICRHNKMDLETLQFADKYNLKNVLKSCIEKNSGRMLTSDEKKIFLQLSSATKLEMFEHALQQGDEKEMKMVDDLLIDISGCCHSGYSAVGTISTKIQQFRDQTKITKLSNKRSAGVTVGFGGTPAKRQRTA